MPSNFTPQSSLHVALMPDGNGRWATARGLPRSAGHRVGVDAVRAAVSAAPPLGIGTLTIHAFSSDNRKRPAPEVRAIFGFVREFLDAETRRCLVEDIRTTVIGRRDRLPADLLASVRAIESATAACRGLHLRLAVDYSARRAIVEAAREEARTAEDFDLAFGRDARDAARGAPVPPVDLLVRTGGEQRLSDFMLWECAYAELLFLPIAWPEFGPEAFRAAIDEFHRRERRFGGLPAPGATVGAA